MNENKSDTKKVFLKKGACSHTFFYILNREFGNQKENEERAWRRFPACRRITRKVINAKCFAVRLWAPEPNHSADTKISGRQLLMQ